MKALKLIGIGVLFGMGLAFGQFVTNITLIYWVSALKSVMVKGIPF